MRPNVKVETKANASQRRRVGVSSKAKCFLVLAIVLNACFRSTTAIATDDSVVDNACAHFYLGYRPDQVFEWFTGNVAAPVSTELILECKELYESSSIARNEYYLGLTYFVTGDFTEGLRLLNLAARGGMPEALFALAAANEFTDPERAVDLYQASAEMGWRPAMSMLGVSYLFGTGGLPKNLPAAIIWLNKAMEMDDILANYIFGIAYAHGAGVPINKIKSSKYFEHAANLGHERSAILLAGLLQSGDGVRKDMNRAFALFLRAAKAGHFEAQIAVSLAYSNAWGVVKNTEYSNYWYEQANISKKRTVEFLNNLSNFNK